MQYVDRGILAAVAKDRQFKVVDTADFMPAMSLALDKNPTALCFNLVQIIIGFDNGDL